jgi:hypothetical protein
MYANMWTILSTGFVLTWTEAGRPLATKEEAERLVGILQSFPSSEAEDAALLKGESVMRAVLFLTVRGAGTGKRLTISRNDDRRYFDYMYPMNVLYYTCCMA